MSRELEEDILQAGPVHVEIDDAGAPRCGAGQNTRRQGQVVEGDMNINWIMIVAL